MQIPDYMTTIVIVTLFENICPQKISGTMIDAG